ncbi:hypothetical protein [Actinomadura macrotermitis]|uniref:Transposase n=1 Tax=Actinomadura macrotermitis TaxID=2585200 RepID=A0A7K0C753_9ACTN|nr:hypothetical protein [Actinomadura macrotermitis]MQY09248.1 hypothetical protein [Actinomadura macrotermitis]
MIERTLAWMFGYRCLIIRYERHGRLFNAFPVLTCLKKLAKLTTRDMLLVSLDHNLSFG